MGIRQRINNFKLKQKIIFYSYIIVTPILLLISMLIFAKNYQAKIKQQNELGINQVQSIDSNLEELNSNLMELSTYLCINTDICSILTTEDEDVKELNRDSKLWLNMAPMRFVQDTLAIKGYIKTLGIYPENGVNPYLSCMDSSSYLPYIENIYQTDLYQQAIENRGKIGWTRIGKESGEVYRANREEKIVLYREIFDLSKRIPLGYMAIGADAKKYNELCEGLLNFDENGIIVLNSKGEIMICCGEVESSIYDFFLSNQFIDEHQKKQKEAITYENQTIYIQENEASGMISCLIVPNSSIWEQIVSIAYAPILLLGGFLIGLYPVLGIVSGIVTKPLGKVQRAMRRFQSGDFSQQVEVYTKDEVGDMAICFNQMVVDIKQLIDQNYVMELRKKESELMALQAQINPHFLYNTLDSLYWQAIDGGNQNIAENILDLSKLFRLVLGDGKGVVSVEQEIALVTEYLKVQKMRFTDRLSYHISVDEEISQVMIPKLILQPFVENAVVHGFENTDTPCEVYVNALKTKDGMLFLIRDTGIGMTKEQIEEVMENEEERYHGQRIGRYAIKNVRQRLEMNYPGQFELHVESEVGNGTEIRIQISLPDRR